MTSCSGLRPRRFHHRRRPEASRARIGLSAMLHTWGGAQPSSTRPRHEQDDHVLTTSANSLEAPRPYPPLASSPPKKPVVFAPDDNTGRLPAPAATSAIRPRPSNPHRLRPAKPRLSFPRFPPYEAFGRRPRAQPRAPAKGRRPKPFSKPAVAKDRDRRCNGVEPGLWEASAQHRKLTPSDSAFRPRRRRKFPRRQRRRGR